MSHYHYLELPCCNKLPIFKEREDEQTYNKPKFSNKFIQLWELLYDIGTANVPTFSGISDAFPIPNKCISRLVGKSIPTLNIWIYSFSNENFDGPIINDGYMLRTYNDEIRYKITWNVREDVDNFVIRFYRPDGYINTSTNTFSLICGNLGPAIFRTSYGSFTSFGIGALFITTNKDTTIELKVEIVATNEIQYPSITRYYSYTKYITLKDLDWQEIKVPVYKISISQDGSSLIKETSRYFFEAAKVITRYLRISGLSPYIFTNLPDIKVFGKITDNKDLGPPYKSLDHIIELSKNFGLLKDCTEGCGSDVIKTRKYNNGEISNISMITDNIRDPQYYVGGFYQGVKLDFSKGKVPKISYTISTNYITNIPYQVNIKIQYKNRYMWYTHNTLDEHGNIIGNAEQIYYVHQGTNAEFSGDFKISEVARAFSIIMHINVDDDITLEKKHEMLTNILNTSTFDKVLVEYVDKVISV